MKLLLERATAIQRVLKSETQTISSAPAFEAAIKCSQELIAVGEAKLALELAEMALASASDMSRESRLRLQVARVAAMRLIGRHLDSLDLIREVRASCSAELQHLHVERNRLAIYEASNLWLLSRADEAVEKLTRLRLELLGDPDTEELALCSLQLSSSEFVRGNYSASRRHVIDALVSARRCGSRFVEALAQNNLDRLERVLCRWASAEEAATEALRIFEELGARIQVNNAKRGLALSLWKRGRLERAFEVVDGCIAESVSTGDRLQEWYFGLFKALLLMHAGKLDEAENLVRAFSSWKPASTESRASLLTTEFLGDIHLEQGEADEAQKYYDEVWPKALALVPKGDIVAELRRRRAEVAYLQGRFDDAYAEAMGGLEHCRELGDRYEEAATYRILALSAGALDRHDEARRWFDQGFAYYDDIETPYEWGKLWLSYGEWLRGPHAGSYADRVGALEAYHAARDHFERMGARARLEIANHRIAEMIAEDAEADRIDSALTAELAESPRHARRRPPGSAELDRRSDWARQTFGIVTRSKQVLHMLEDIAKLAASRTPILVLGESGTGKELVAGGVHALSGRTGAFVPVNCGALPREIIESELFGHTAGSFTGAVRDKAGLVEVCDGGTIFLDEIAEMTLESQSRVLRFLETGESRRVGSTRNVAVDTRIVAATNRDRHSLEQGKGFRPDLYYRLAHAVVTLPPLRRRGEDVELLIDHFLAEVCAEEGRDVALSARALKRLRKYPWPGNVRQLRSVIRRTVLLATPGIPVDESLLQLDDGTRTPGNLLEEMEHTEKQRLSDALAAARGSRTDAARALGIPRTTFINKMKRFGIG